MSSKDVTVVVEEQTHAARTHQGNVDTAPLLNAIGSASRCACSSSCSVLVQGTGLSANKFRILSWCDSARRKRLCSGETVAVFIILISFDVFIRALATARVRRAYKSSNASDSSGLSMLYLLFKKFPFIEYCTAQAQVAC